MKKKESAFSRARTVDPLIKSQLADLHNLIPINTYNDSKSALAPFLAPAAIPIESLADPDLIHVICAWHKIPDNMKAVIKSMSAMVLPLETLPTSQHHDEQSSRQT